MVLLPILPHPSYFLMEFKKFTPEMDECCFKAYTRQYIRSVIIMPITFFFILTPMFLWFFEFNFAPYIETLIKIYISAFSVIVVGCFYNDDRGYEIYKSRWDGR